MASKEKLPSGRYRGIYRDANGDKQHVKGTFARAKDALAAAQKAEVEARSQASGATGDLSASITWDQWWEVLSATRQFESDSEEFERYVAEVHISPHWGKEPLNKIRHKDVQDWIDSYADKRKPDGKPYKPSSIRRFYGVFAVSINAAIRKGILTASPLAGIKLPKVQRRVAKKYVSVDDGQTLGDVFRQRGRDDYADVIDFELETGLRPGEMIGLHDDQFDLRRKVVVVRTVYVRSKGKMRDIPKDGEEREIPLTTRAIEIYHRRTAGRDMRRSCGFEHFDGEACTSDLVFRTNGGSRLDVAALRRAMYRASRSAGLDRTHPYALRRGFATRLRAAGADVMTIMELMGHSTAQETHGYAQQPPDFDRRVQAFLGDPSASPLKIVGQDGERGTGHGTDPQHQPSSDGTKRRRRKSG